MEPKNKSSFNRRDFLKTGALSGLFLGTAGLAGCVSTNGKKTPSFEGRVKNVIFLVSDGMSIGTLQMCDLLRRRKEGRASTWIRLYEQGKVTRSLMDMTTGNSNVPDSAAAASSWGSGVRITNGAVNMMDDGEQLDSLVPLFKAAGKKTALVTTARVTHATPAGFCASVASRGMEDDIAMQYYERKPDIIMGGGNRHFDGASREDGIDLYEKFKADGYHIARNKSDLVSLNPGFNKVLGVFAEHHLPYNVDHLHNDEHLANVPTLAEMTKLSLDMLHASGDGFLIQIEGARIDHGAHGMDAPAMIYDQVAFDEAVEVAFDFYEKHPDDTLIIITTDHGNANPGLNGAGSYYKDSVPNFDKLQNFKHTNEWVQHGFGDGVPSVSQIVERTEYATGGIVMSREHAELYRTARRREHRAAHNDRSNPWFVYGELMSNYTSIVFASSSHTADYVELAAAGPGSETLGAFVKNTDLFTLMTLAAGVPAPVKLRS